MNSSQDYEFSTDWFSNNIPQLQALFRDHLPCITKILEIGSYEGRSASWMIENLLRDGGEIVCVDPWSTNDHAKQQLAIIKERRFDNNIEIALRKYPGVRVRKMDGISRICLRQLSSEGYDETFDFVYVDGCHEAAEVLEDLVAGFRLCRLGGIIACDDYLWKFGANPTCTPKLAVDCFTNCYSGKIEIIAAPNWQIYLRKRSS